MILPLLLAGAGGVAFRTEPLRFEPAPASLVVRDVTGDGRADLVAAEGNELTVRPQGRGAFAGEVSARIARPSSAVLFDVADLDGDGKAELVLLESGKAARAIAFDGEGKPGEPATLLAAPRAHAPLGLRRARLVRDLDGDGDGDLALPGAAETLLFARGADGQYAPAGSVPTDVEVTLAVGDPRLVTARDLKEKFDSSWTVPLFELADLNGDGRRDLVSETEDAVVFTLASADGSFPAQPTFRLDLERLRKALPRDAAGRTLDPDNLAASVSNRVEWVRRDLDGDGREDFVVRAGNVLTVYRGGPGGVDFAAKPAQVLKASGNLLGLVLVDDDGDGKHDLVLARLQDISLAEALSFLLLPIRISVDVFVYRSREGGTFSPRPDRRQRFTISLPSARNLKREAERFRRRSTEDPVAARGDLDGDGERDDLLLVRPSGAIEVYLGAAAGTPIGEPRTLLAVLKELGWGSPEPEVVVNLDRIADLAGRTGAMVEKAIEGRKPDWSTRPAEALPEEAEEDLSVWVFDLDGDRRDDAIVGWLTPGSARDRPFVATVVLSSPG